MIGERCERVNTIVFTICFLNAAAAARVITSHMTRFPYCIEFKSVSCVLAVFGCGIFPIINYNVCTVTVMFWRKTFRFPEYFMKLPKNQIIYSSSFIKQRNFKYLPNNTNI